MYQRSCLATKANKANQHQSLRSLDSLPVALFLHGFAISAQKINNKSAAVFGDRH
jgi:hypothetical protein